MLGFGSFLNCGCLIFGAFSFESYVDSFCLRGLLSSNSDRAEATAP